MNIKELRNLTGMSQKKFADYFGISFRTIQQWEQERSAPPSYLVGLLKRILDFEYFNKVECDTISEADYDKDTGLPLDKSYLECGLPPYVQESLEAMKKSWAIVDNGGEDLRWDCYWCELNADLNSAEVEGLITSEQAWYLREKYLRMERRGNIE